MRFTIQNLGVRWPDQSARAGRIRVCAPAGSVRICPDPLGPATARIRAQRPEPPPAPARAPRSPPARLVPRARHLPRRTTRMAIDRIDIDVTSPGRNFVTAVVTTSDGFTGLGDATLNGRELSVASYLRDHVAPTLIGRDESAIEQTWQYLYRGAYWRRGPVTLSAIAA